jgi:hypothetical protein
MSCTAIPLRRALSTNSTDTSFSAKNATETRPSGAGVFDLLDSDLGLSSGSNVPSYIELIPYGADADTETFDMRLWGWKVLPAAEAPDGRDVWVPIMLADVSCTLTSATATPLMADNFLCDTLVLNEGAADGAFTSIITTADDTTASLLVHTRGCQLIEFAFDLTGAESVNCLWTAVD